MRSGNLGTRHTDPSSKPGDVKNYKGPVAGSKVEGAEAKKNTADLDANQQTATPTAAAPSVQIPFAAAIAALALCVAAGL